MGATGATTEQAIGTAAAARMLGVSEARVRQLADAGALPFVRTTHGRLFDPADLDALIAERERAGRERTIHGSGAVSVSSSVAHTKAPE